MNINTLIAMTTGQQTQPLTFMETSSETDSQTAGTSTPAATNDTAQERTAQSAAAQGEEFTTFLTLLTAQIRNQDPLAPLDSTQFVEQLATFSSLELQANGNAALDRISGLLAQQLALSNQTTPSES